MRNSDKILPKFKLVIVALLAACVAGFAGEEADRDTENFEYRFYEVLTHKLNFEYDDAFLNALDLAEDLRDNLRTTDPKLTGYAIASLLVLQEIAAEAGKLSSVEYLEVFNRKTKDARVNALLTKLKNEAYLAQGKYKEAKDCAQELGFITDWQIIGPFRNDTNTGMQIAYPPESLVPWGDEKIDGSVREVGWRSLPFEPFMGIIDFKTLLTPYEESCAYSLAIVNNTSDGNILGTLRIGSSGSFKCFVNGSADYSKDISRDLRFDQDVFAVNFKPGYNSVLFKWGNSQNNEFKAQVRLTDINGNINDALKVLTIDENWWDNLENAYEDWKNSSPKPEKAKFKNDFTSEFKESMTDSSKAVDYLVLALLENHFETYDKNKFMPKSYLDQALQLQPDNSIVTYLAAMLSIDESKSRYERELNNKRKLLIQAAYSKPAIAAPTFELAKFYALQENKFETEKYLKQADLLIQNKSVMYDLKKTYYEIRGWDIEIAKLKAEALEKWNNNSADYQTVKFLSENNNSLLQPTVERLYSQHNAYGFLREYLNILEESSRSEQAEKLYHEVLQMDPYVPVIRNILIRNYVGRQKFSEALKQAEILIQIDADNASNWYRLGNFYFYLGDVESADSAWEKALQLNPQFTELQEYLRIKLQKTTNYENKFFANVSELIEQAKNQDFKRDYPIEIIYNHDIYNLKPDGSYKHVIYSVKRITNSDGSSDYSDDSPIGFNKGHIYFARIYKKNGDILKAEIDGTWIDYGILEVGDIIELAAEMQVKNDGVFGDYYGDKYFFSWDVPVKRAQLTYCFPNSRKFNLYPAKTVQSAVISEDSDANKTIYNWVYTDISPVESEENMPYLTELVDYLEVSTYSSWDEFAIWYENLIKHQTVVTQKIRDKVADLTKNLTTINEKIRAIYYFVTNSIRYDAEWVFGVHGYKPFTADTILSRQFGDCKDKSILLITMLMVLDVKAYPVMIDLTMHRSEEDVSLAMIGHFNHMISVVEMPNGSMKYLDGTAEFHPFEIIPEYDSDAQVVIIKDGKGVLARTPATKPEENLQNKIMKLEISEDGTAKGTVEMFYNGSWEPFVRKDYEQKSKILPQIQKYYTSNYPETKISNLKFFDVYDMSVPVDYSYEIEIKGFAKRNNGELTINPVMSPSNLINKAGGSIANRSYDLILTPPNISKLRIELKLPANFEISNIPESVKLESDFMKLTFTSEISDNTVILQYERRFTKSRIKTTDFKNYLTMAKKYGEIENAKLRFKINR